MNLADVYFLDGNGVHFRNVSYCGQLAAQLALWQRTVGERFTMVPRESRPHPEQPQRGTRGFRRGSVPYRVALELAECAPAKLTASEVAKLLPRLRYKPISVALYELTRKHLLRSEGSYQGLRYGVTQEGLDMLAEYAES
jgi:hypothetical protein